MKVTTVRFSEDLWDAVAREAALSGLSASQFIREAALARAAAAAGARGELPFGSYSATVAEISATTPESSAHPREIQRALALLARAVAADIRGEAGAVRAQSRQSQHRARQLKARKAGSGSTQPA